MARTRSNNVTLLSLSQWLWWFWQWVTKHTTMAKTMNTLTRTTSKKHITMTHTVGKNTLLRQENSRHNGNRKHTTNQNKNNNKQHIQTWNPILSNKQNNTTFKLPKIGKVWHEYVMKLNWDVQWTKPARRNGSQRLTKDV